jgi:peroxiredoxin
MVDIHTPCHLVELLDVRKGEALSDTIEAIQVGAMAPDFILEDILSGVAITLSELRGKTVVVNFWSGKCPWSRQYDDYFAERAEQWETDSIWLLHICSNADEPPAEVEALAHDLDIASPLLYDPGNAVADAYGAQATPHVFVIDPQGRLAYQGAVDDRSFDAEPTRNYLDAAVEAARINASPDPAETLAYGCALVRHAG